MHVKLNSPVSLVSLLWLGDFATSGGCADLVQGLVAHVGVLLFLFLLRLVIECLGLGSSASGSLAPTSRDLQSQETYC